LDIIINVIYLHSTCVRYQWVRTENDAMMGSQTV